MASKPWQFQPGVSGNPSGRPATKSIELKKLLEDHIPSAAELLLKFVNDKKLHPKIRLEAMKELFDRGIGRPHQTTDLKVEGQIPAVLTGELSDDDISSMETPTRPPTNGVQEH
jgi:hypothetical protein